MGTGQGKLLHWMRVVHGQAPSIWDADPGVEAPHAAERGRSAGGKRSMSELLWRKKKGARVSKFGCAKRRMRERRRRKGDSCRLI